MGWREQQVVPGWGADPAKIRAYLGWTSETIQDRYTHIEPEHLKEQIKIVEGLF
jgi:hypothetical protein